MASINIFTRLAKLEKKKTDDFSEIRIFIKQGKHFNELSEEQQEKYIRYKESLGGVAADYAAAHLEMLIENVPKEVAFNFPLSERQPPPSKEELEKSIKEVEMIVSDFSHQKT